MDVFALRQSLIGQYASLIGQYASFARSFTAIRCAGRAAGGGGPLEAVANAQAERLLADHRRVRQAAKARGRYEGRALTPVDVVAAYLLLPPA